MDNLKKDSKKFKKALQIIYTGKDRLSQTPRADMDGFEPAEVQKEQLKKYLVQLEKEQLFKEAIVNGEKRYDSKD